MCALGSDGEQHNEEEHDDLGAKEDFLQVGEDSLEQRNCLNVNFELICFFQCYAEPDEKVLTDLKEDFKLSRRDAKLCQCPAFSELIDVLAFNNMQMKRTKRTKTVRASKLTFLIPNVFLNQLKE